MSHSLMALSPLDGRYASQLAELSCCSEFGLIRYRLQVELAWLLKLNEQGFTPVPFGAETRREIETVMEHFTEADAGQVKAIEKVTNHDVKAVEYWIRERFAKNSEVKAAEEFIHFGCTSEDITNVSHALMLRKARFILLEPLNDLMLRLQSMAHEYAGISMLSHTHGQPATPTTLGKELANFCYRLKRAYKSISEPPLFAKWNGAVGNYNAHMVAYPDINWEKLNRAFIHEMGLEWNPYTTQIEPHDSMCELFDAFARVNTILIGMNRDLWQYVSLGYFKQRVKEGEVGSSTMPHKVNPIDFENSEGNLGMANAILGHLSEKLPISRLQRDLTDSTVTRNIGVALGYSLLAYRSCLKGLGKLEVDRVRLAEDLDDKWELLAEPVQMVLRRYGVSGAYEKLKALTRGKGITKDALHEFVGGLEIPDEDKERLLALTPATYIGLAAELARKVQGVRKPKVA